jgi:hypothetical protein
LVCPATPGSLGGGVVGCGAVVAAGAVAGAPGAVVPEGDGLGASSANTLIGSRKAAAATTRDVRTRHLI